MTRGELEQGIVNALEEFHPICGSTETDRGNLWELARRIARAYEVTMAAGAGPDFGGVGSALSRHYDAMLRLFLSELGKP